MGTHNKYRDPHTCSALKAVAWRILATTATVLIVMEIRLQIRKMRT